MSRSAPRSIDQYLKQLRESLAGADAALIQDRQELRVAAALLADQILRGHPHVVEGQLAGVRGAPADLGVLRPHGQPGRASWHHDG